MFHMVGEPKNERQRLLARGRRFKGVLRGTFPHRGWLIFGMSISGAGECRNSNDIEETL